MNICKNESDKLLYVIKKGSFMVTLWSCFKSKRCKDKSLEQKIQRELPVLYSRNQRERDARKFLSLLSFINNKKEENAMSQNVGSYIEALGESTFHSGEAGYILSSSILVGATAAESLKGIGLGLYAGVDLGNSIIRSKRISDRNSNDLKLTDSLKHSSTRPFRVFRFKKNNDKEDFIMLGLSDKSHFYDEQKLSEAYKKISHEIIEQGEFYNKKKLIRRINNLLTIKECINNIKLRSMGLKYGFFSVKDKFQDSENPFDFLVYKIPESIYMMKEDIKKLKKNEHGCNRSDNRILKDLEHTINKLQLIQVFDSLKRINKIRNKIDAHYAVVDITQALGASMGFGGMVTLLAQPFSAPVSAPVLASGIALRTVAVLYSFIRKRIDSNEVNKLFDKANDIDNKFVNKAKLLMAELSDPIICEKFPQIFKSLLEAMNEVSPSDTFMNSYEEKIIEKFESIIKDKIKLDSELRKEWQQLKPEWEEYKKKTEIISSQADLREFCNSTIECIAKFIMQNIKTLKNPQNLRDIDKIVDTLISARVLSEIIKFAGINYNDSGINPGEFIEKVVQAKDEADIKKYSDGSELVTSINLNQRLTNFYRKMNDLIDAGESELNAVVSLSHEFETLMFEKITAAQKEVENNSGSIKLIVLGDELITSMKKLI
jgi:hypothetical protein